MSDERYYVWAFRRHQGCYDCGATEQIEAESNASAVELSEDDFNAFLKGAAALRYNSEHVFLYRKSGDNALTPKIMELVERGNVELAEQRKREALRKEKAAAKAEKAKDASVRRAEKEAKEKRKLYEQLKAEFET